MTKLQRQKGFTLVELAIVITIIGLLIGGILKAQELMDNARVLATVAQVKAVEAGSMTFNDSYGALPGDMDGTNKIPGCTAACQIPAATAHDQVIGDPAWAMTTPEITGGLPAAATIESETGLFWYYLAATGMISSIDGSAPDTTDVVFGKTSPATKFGGGFIVGNSNGSTLGSRATGSAVVSIKGTVLSIVLSPTLPNNILTPGGMVLRPSIAARIDRKMDDGLPGSGSVQAFGNSGCVNVFNIAIGAEYIEANQGKHCGLYIGING
jgi:prepilin-type N-terminal cleavage/methylation domain-containing protein